jgi:hypothetical protein
LFYINTAVCSRSIFFLFIDEGTDSKKWGGLPKVTAGNWHCLILDPALSCHQSLPFFQDCPRNCNPIHFSQKNSQINPMLLIHISFSQCQQVMRIELQLLMKRGHSWHAKTGLGQAIAMSGCIIWKLVLLIHTAHCLCGQ